MKVRFCVIFMIMILGARSASAIENREQVDPKAFKTAAEASEAPRLSLETCLKQALESNFAVRIARNNFEIADNNVTAKPFLPTVTATTNQSQDQRSDVTSEFHQDAVSVGTRLGWVLFDGMAMFATRSLQSQQRHSSELELKSEMEQLIADVMNQYYAIAIQQRRVAAARQYLEISAMRYAQALEKYNVGRISGLEMKQAKIDLNADSSQLISDLEQLRSSCIALYELMNVDLDSRHTISDEITYDGNLNFVELKDYAKYNNTNILRSANGEQIAASELRLSRSLRYPVLEFSTGYNYNFNKVRPNADFDRSNGYNWGFSLSIPIFNGLDVNRKVRNAKLTVKNSLLNSSMVELSVMSDMSQLYNSYRTNLRMINFEAESADAARLNMDAALDMYRLGSLSGTEFREIQRSYMSAEMRKLSALYQTKISEISLIYLAGKLIYNGSK